jgi:DNA-3-methyladenine glycosylase
MHTTHGYIYVYTIYGRNLCVNITTDENFVGAILIRALEPLTKIEVMAKRRGTDELTNLCSGPGKLCQALGIDMSFNWTEVGDRVNLYSGKAGKIISTRRIGITRATDLHWRFIEANNSYVSRRR